MLSLQANPRAFRIEVFDFQRHVAGIAEGEDAVGGTDAGSSSLREALLVIFSVG